MKQEPEVIKRFRSFTQETIHTLKNQLNEQCSVQGAKACASTFEKQMQILQAFVLSMISEFGNEYIKTIQNWTSASCSMLAVKSQNKDLQQKLDHTYQLLQEKDHKIQELASKNLILSETVIYLQQRLASQASLINGEDILSQDSLENVDLDGLSHYVSESESEDEGAPVNQQSDYGL